MNKKDCKIHIIGAGVSGLVAAKVLEDNGYSPVIIEATERVGGRVKNRCRKWISIGPRFSGPTYGLSSCSEIS